MLVYVGTYTQKSSKGIYLYRFDSATGKLAQVGLAAESINPSFLAIHPNGRLLYACNETEDFGGQKTGALTAYSIDRKTGLLTKLNQQQSNGAAPCHVAVDKAGKAVFTANYTGGSLAVFPIDDDGRLKPATTVVNHHGKGVNPDRQEAAHVHCVNLDAANHFLISADLGLDKVFVYKFNSSIVDLTENEPPFATIAPGSGPRHFAFHPSGKYGYVINEMGNTVTAFRYDSARGALAEFQTVPTLPIGFSGENTTAEIEVHPSGKFLYGSNRGHDSIAIFTIDQANGKLTPAGHALTGGKTPRNFTIDPTGHWLLAANQDTDNITVFRIDLRTGGLREMGRVDAPMPVCVTFLR